MKNKVDNRKDYIANHFVPETYLKNFAFDGKRCFIITDGVNKVVTNSISKIAYENYLNSRDYEIFINKNYENKFGKGIGLLMDYREKVLSQQRLLQIGLSPPYSPPPTPGCFDFIFDLAAFLWSHNRYTREFISQNISNDLKNRLPQFSNLDNDFRTKDFYAKDVFENVRRDIENWKVLLRFNPNQGGHFITSDNLCQISSVTEDLLKNINDPIFETSDGERLFANNIKVKYSLKTQDRIDVITGAIHITIDENSMMQFPLTPHIYVMMFKNADVVDYIRRETSFDNTDITPFCNHFVYRNKKKQCYSKTEESLKVYI